MPSRKEDDIIKENDSPIWYFADKRHTNEMFIPDNSIIFEVEIPLDELLLTHYDAYHCVLDEIYNGNELETEFDLEISDEEFEASMENFNNSRYYTKDEYELAKYNSWEKYVIMSKDNINYSVLQALSWRGPLRIQPLISPCSRIERTGTTSAASQ